MTRSPGGRALAAALALALTAAAVAPGLPFLHDFFGQWDDLSLMENADVSGPGGLAHPFTRPLHHGDQFAASRFQRPVYQLSYTLDLAVWGVGPTGYRVTNILLHVLALWLLVLFARRLTGSRELGWTAALLFALSPIQARMLADPMPRSDILVALFWMAAFLAFERRRRGGRGAWLAGSVVLFALAVWSKETGYLFVPFLLGWVYLSDRPPGLAPRRALARSVRAIAPFTVAAALLLAWRLLTVGVVGRYVWGRASGSFKYAAAALLRIANVFKSFALSLVLPRGNEREFFALFPPWLRVLLFLGLVAAAAAILRARRESARSRRRDDDAGGAAADRTERPAALLLWASGLGLAAVPAVVWGLDRIVRSAFEGRGVLWITALMTSRDRVALAAYRWKLAELAAGLAVAAFAVSAAWLGRRRWLPRALAFARAEPGPAVLGGLLAAYLLLFSGMQYVAYWYMYLPALAFSILLARAAAGAVARLRQAGRREAGSPLASLPAVGVLLLTALLAASWPASFRRTRDRDYLRRLELYAEALSGLDRPELRGRTLRLEGFPVLYLPPEAGADIDLRYFSEELERNFLRWAKVAFAGRGWTVGIGSRAAYESVPERPGFAFEPLGDGTVALRPRGAEDPGIHP